MCRADLHWGALKSFSSWKSFSLIEFKKKKKILKRIE